MCFKSAKEQRRLFLLVQWAAFAITVIGCFAVLRFVVPAGDDFFYGRWGKLPAAQFFAKLGQHYMMANGRSMVHMIDSLLLGSDVGIWAARALIALAIGWIVRCGFVLSAPRGSARMIGIAVLWVCGIFLLPVYMTRQTLYWITGAMNYVLPLALLFTYWVLLRDSLAGKRGWKLTSAFALLSGLTMEQIAVMTIGLTILLCLYHCLLRKKAFPRAVLWPFFLSLVGMCSVVFAPGNFYRSSITDSPVEGGALRLAWYNLLNMRRNFLFGEAMYPIHFLTLISVPVYFAVRAVKRKKIASGLLAVLGTFSFFLWMLLPQWDEQLLSYADDVPREVDCMFLTILMAYLLMTLLAALAELKCRRPQTMCAWILGVGSQLMMLVLPTSGPRTMLCCVGMQLLFMSALMRTSAFPFLLLSGAAMGFWQWEQPWVAAVIAAVLVVRILWRVTIRRKTLYALGMVLCLIPIVFCAWTVLRDTRHGYHENYVFDRLNRQTLSQAAIDGALELTLHKLPNEYYGWVMPYENAYYNEHFDVYYGLSQHAVITWE